MFLTPLGTKRAGRGHDAIQFFFSIASVLTLFASVSTSLNAQVFAPVPALSFTKSFGGADPLPQNPTIAAVGTGFNFSITSATTNSGGSWLSTSTITGCGLCATPRTISVIVTTAVNLAVGTYTGQVVLTSQSGSVTLTIPVTLTVVTAGATIVDNLPGQVSFSLLTASTTPTSQTIQIRNAGSGTLSWTATKSTSDGGSWLTISSTSGSAPSFLTVGLVPGNLPGGGLVAGTFVGQIILQAASGNVTIPVSVVLGTNILSQVNPISFTKVFGGANPLPQTLTMATPGTAFNFFVSASTANGGAWFTVATTTGCGLCVTPNTFVVTVNPIVTLPVGNYTGQIEITSQFGSQTITIPVTLTVAAAGSTYLDNLQGQMNFSMTTGGTTLTTQDLQVRNGGSGTLSWTAAVSTADGGNWLSVSAPSGTAPAYITVAISVPNLPNAGLIAGTFIGQVVIQTTGSAVTVPISVTVGTSVFEQVNPISFTKFFGGANPLPQTLTVATPGTAFNYFVSASTATGGTWLTVATATGCGLCATPNTVVATVNASPTLAVGTYTGQIVITSQSGNLSMTVPVTLTVAAAATTFFDNVPGQMTFTMQTGGTAVTGQTLQIRNGGTGTLNWTLEQSTSDGGNWLTVSAPSGTAPSFVNVGVSVANIPGGGLIAGTFVGELVFRTAGSSVTVSVNFIVGANIFNQVNAISFTKSFNGANPLPQTLTISTPGSPFNYFITSSTATGGAWLTAATVTACGLCAMPNAIVATVNASPTLAVGTYTGQIVVTSQSGNMSMTIPVTLTVTAAGATSFDNLPGQMSFFLQTGGGNPATQNVRIRNAGSGTLFWTLAQSTSDTGNWLNISAPNGTAPATETVSISVSSLPGGGLIAGTFIGQLLFQSASGSVTVPVTVTVGPNVFVQLSALSFTKAFGGSNPVSQTLNIASSGTAFNFFIESASGNGGSWLTASTIGGCGLCATPHGVTAAITASPTLPVGTYTAQIVMYSQSGNMSMTVPITLTVGTPPGAVPSDVSPSSGSGSTQTFSFTFDAPNGFASLTVVDVLINNFLDGIGACYVAYVPSSGSLLLVDDAGDAGGPYSAMTLPGTGTIQNSQCSISGAGSSVTGSGDTLTLTLVVTFKPSFSGNKVFYTAAQDTASSGWHALGTWSVPGAPPVGPTVSSVTPAHSVTAEQLFTVTFTDSNGFGDISITDVLINNFLDGIGACYVAYIPSINAVVLVDNAGDAGGPYAGSFIMGSGSAANSQCTINGANSSVSGNGNMLTLMLDITFNHSFAGERVIYAAAGSNTANSGWLAVGTQTVP